MSRWTASEIVGDVERRVASGNLNPGDKLAAVRVLADELGIAPNTVAAAYRRLRERGVVVGRGRQGTIVAIRTTVQAVPYAPMPSDLVDAASGNPDQSLLPRATSRMLLAAAKPGGRYGNAMVVDELIKAGSAWLADDGLEVSRLTVASGAMDAIERILGVHCLVGDRIGVEDPGHSPVHQMVAALGLVAVPMQLDERGVTPAALHGALELGVSVVVLTPRAQNPTGATFDAERTAELRTVLETYPSVLVIEDDHAGPVAGVPVHYLDHDRRRWVVVRSVAKTLGPDYRLALVVGDEQTLDRIEGRMQMGAGWVSHFLQRIVASLLSDPAAQKKMKSAAAAYTSRRNRLVAALAKQGIASTASSGFQVWIPVTEEEPAIVALRDKGYAIRGASGYRIASAPAVRVTISALTNNQIDEIAELLVGVLHRKGRGITSHSRTI